MVISPPPPPEIRPFTPVKIKPPPATAASVFHVEQFKTFYHSGDLGDVVMSLVTIKSLGGGVMVLGPNIGHAPFITRERMTPERANLVIPLLRMQPYIKGARYVHGQMPTNHDLNQFRLGERFKVDPHLNLAHAVLIYLKQDVREADKAWLTIDQPVHVKGRPVIVSRSPRYHGDLDWKALYANYKDQMIFVGLDDEYIAFEAQIGKVPRHPTQNLLDVARLIAGAELFIGNQSCPNAIAEGLKQTLIQETWPNACNVTFDRPNAWYGRLPDILPRVGGNKAVFVPLKRKKLSINFRSPVDGFSGIGQTAARFIIGLRDLGHVVSNSPTRSIELYGAKPDRRLNVADPKPKRDSIQIVYETAEHLQESVRHGDIVITLWESSVWPQDAVKALNKAKVVFVTCKWNAITLEACGCTSPIRVLPLGVDTKTFQPGASRPPICTFGAAGRPIGKDRKGIDVLVSAFREAFPYQKDVKLRIKAFRDSAIDTQSDQRIDVTRTMLTPDNLVVWYRQITAFVSASKAEGFGLCLLEAMACGCAPAACNFGGQSEFFDSSIGYGLPFTMQDATDQYLGSGQWAVPDTNYLMLLMRRIYTNQQEAWNFGVAAAERASQFTFDKTVSKLEDELLRL